MALPDAGWTLVPDLGRIRRADSTGTQLIRRDGCACSRLVLLHHSRRSRRLAVRHARHGSVIGVLVIVVLFI